MAGTGRVLIAGAGPVGLTLAGELARYGVGVRIVDTSAARTDKSKALVLWSRSLELLARTGRAQDFVAAGMEVYGARISNGRTLIAEIDFDAAESLFPAAVMIPQSETERLLETHLESLGVKVERTTGLTGFALVGDGVHATLRDASGREEQVEADWLVGCDGAHSTVRHTLGMDFAGSTQPSDWVLADVHLEGLTPDKLDIYWHSDGILAFFPITGGRYRMVADLGPAQSEAHRPDPTLAEVQALVDARGPGGIRMHDPFWLANFRINERKVKDYSLGRAFLAGDAAHIHSPAGGQGMNTGMQDAFNLAWKLALVVRGRARPALLDSYSVERSAVGDLVLHNATRMTDLAVMRNPLAQAVRNFAAHVVLGLSQVQRRASHSLTELEIAYPHSPLSVTAPHAPHGGDLPKAGERWPQLDASLPPIGAGDTPRFALIAHGAAARDLAAGFGGLVETREPPAGYDGLWVVRPDGYVGLVAGATDLSAAEAYLAALLA
ncbi:FAD-dependent monooxygenase [Roseixanthobacter glucoisosaccharinicivorans]|uniref:FAD-dependent monooxygenase n=1 Tax=Roseixanthobacter glucoisosaccharinicivorans TaxID=3119923 RepID=UPI00372B32BB